MTRKRFVKLIMARGIQRNTAQQYAERYRVRGFSYKKAYADFLIRKGISLSFNRLGNAIYNASSNLNEMIIQIEKFKDAIRYEIRGEFK